MGSSGNEFWCKSEVVQGRGKLFGLEKWKWEWVCMCSESMKLLCEGGLHLVCMSAESLEFACERGLSFGLSIDLHFSKALLFFFLFFCGLAW